MVNDPANKWQSLESKLRAGHSLRGACELAGLAVQDAREYLEFIQAFSPTDTADEVCLRECLTEALSILKEVGMLDIDPETRVKAAGELLKFYRQEKARLEKKAPESGKNSGEGAELFDNWGFLKKPKA
jgi:hypothetical protein